MNLLKALAFIFTLTLSNVANAKETIILIGDSLAVGLREHFKKDSYKKGYNPVVLAKIGDHLYGWSRKINTIRSYKPSYLLICLGTNDGVTKTSPVLNNPDIISKLDKKIRDMGAVPIWIGPPEMPKKSVPFIDSIRKSIQDRVPLFFDSRPMVEFRSDDGIHYMGQGYKLWMEEIWGWALKEELL